MTNLWIQVNSLEEQIIIIKRQSIVEAFLTYLNEEGVFTQQWLAPL